MDTQHDSKSELCSSLKIFMGSKQKVPGTYFGQKVPFRDKSNFVKRNNLYTIHNHAQLKICSPSPKGLVLSRPTGNSVLYSSNLSSPGARDGGLQFSII